MYPASAAPFLAIPQSLSTVNVSIIDPGVSLRLPLSQFMGPPIQGHSYFDAPVFSFLIDHPVSGKVLFDLGLRKDWENLAPIIVETATAHSWDIEVEKDVLDVIEEAGTHADEINSVIWSHSHLDHAGDMSRFPSTTALVVGAGFSKALIPGYPQNPESPILETDYSGRSLLEMNFTLHPNRLTLGRFDAIDFFGDGSFYLIDSPDHAVGHVCGLARTTPSTFIFMGGDAAHHNGEFRPSQFLPLPSEISPSPFSTPPFVPGTVCPGALVQRIQPNRSRTQQFYWPQDGDGMKNYNLQEMKQSIDKMEDFDANENILVVIAHDTTLLDVADFFPETANAWKEKQWKSDNHWRFLSDFSDAFKNIT